MLNSKHTNLCITAMLLVGGVSCGVDETTHTAPIYWADIDTANPQANLGGEGCEMRITKAEIDAAVPIALTADGVTLPISHFTTTGKVYSLEDENSIKSVELFRMFARASIICK